MPESDKTVRILPTWNGFTAKVYKGDDAAHFCIDCNYTIVVETKNTTSYWLEYHIERGIRVLDKTETFVFDIVLYGKKNCYLYTIDAEDENEDLNINLSAFSGNSTVLVQPGHLPLNTERFEYESVGFFDENLLITAEDREKSGLKSGDYYICVYGRYTSAYELGIMMSHDTDFTIQNGYTKSMDVENNQLLAFNYILKGDEDRNIIFTLYSETGNTDLYVKYCEVEHDYLGVLGDCTLTKQEIGEFFFQLIGF